MLFTSCPAPDADPPPQIRVALQASRADDPASRFTLLERTYQASEVVGRRIHLGFAPLLSPERLAQVRVADIETLVPVMNVSAPDMTQAERDGLAVVGDAFSRGGDRYHLDSGALSVNGTPLATSQPGAAARVSRIGLSAQASNYPRVEISVSALDGKGADVEGLGADSLSVSDNGQPVSFSLTQNQAPPPRVVLIYDTSSSIPEDFRGPGAVSSAGRIVDGIFAQFPTAQVRVATAFFGAEWMSPDWAGTAADAERQVAALASASGDSTIWQAVLAAEAEHPTLIVLFSDGDAEDAITPEIANGIAAGPPILTVGVGSVVPSSLLDMASRSGGHYVSAESQSEAEAAVAEALSVNAKNDYIVTFQAPNTPGPHALTVKIGGASGTTTYDVPAKPTVPPALSGLYLTLRVGQREATRALAGHARAATTSKPVIDQATLDDVTAMLFGRVSISVEAASPTAAVVLDDWLAEKSTLKPLWQAIEGKNATAIEAALKQGIALTPGKLPLAQPPLRDASGPAGLTFATAPHLAAMVQKARSGKAFTRELDLFPLNRWITAAQDGSSAWLKTFRATAGLAIMEKHLMRGTSTAAALVGQKLTALLPGQADLQTGLTDDERLRWMALQEPFPSNEFTLLVPTKPGAFWAVDNLSGTLVGILPDGSGGASEDACSAYNFANNALTLAGLLGGFAGASIGGWVALMQWEVKYVTIATIVIGGGTLSGDTSLSNPAIDMGCGMLDDALGDFIPGLGEYEQITDTLDLAGIDTGAPSLCGGDDSLCQ